MAGLGTMLSKIVWAVMSSKNYTSGIVNSGVNKQTRRGMEIDGEAKLGGIR